MVKKKDFVKIITQARDTYQSWRTILNALGKGSEYIEDTVTDLVDASLEFAAAAMGDKGLPAEHDTLDRLGDMGYDMPIVLWWAWENDWGNGEMEFMVDEERFDVSTVEQLYELLVFIKGADSVV